MRPGADPAEFRRQGRRAQPSQRGKQGIRAECQPNSASALPFGLRQFRMFPVQVKANLPAVQFPQDARVIGFTRALDILGTRVVRRIDVPHHRTLPPAGAFLLVAQNHAHPGQPARSEAGVRSQEEVRAGRPVGQTVGIRSRGIGPWPSLSCSMTTTLSSMPPTATVPFGGGFRPGGAAGWKHKQWSWLRRCTICSQPSPQNRA